MKKKEEIVVRYHADGRVTMETHGLKGKKCEEVTEDVFKKLGKGQPGAESKRTKEYYQGGNGSNRTLRQG